jgi:hypothetical protein
MRKLQFEQLEDRSLLAVASFAINLFHDDEGVPGTPLADDSVEVGQTFFAQIVAREYHPGFSGLAGISLDIAWDAAILSIVEPFDPKVAVTPNLPLFVGGRLLQEDSNIRPFVVDSQIRQDVGTVDGLGGSAFPAWGAGRPIGSDGDDQFVKPQYLGLSTTDDHFAWLQFQAEGVGEALLTMRQGGLRITTMPAASLSSKHIHFEPQIVTVVEPIESAQSPLVDVAIIVNYLNSGEVTHPPHLDVNGDGFVTTLDAILLINFNSSRENYYVRIHWQAVVVVADHVVGDHHGGDRCLTGGGGSCAPTGSAVHPNREFRAGSDSTRIDHRPNLHAVIDLFWNDLFCRGIRDVVRIL